jgi:hypothetical protein
MRSQTRRAVIQVAATAATQVLGLTVVTIAVALADTGASTGSVIQLAVFWYILFGLIPLVLWALIVLVGAAVRHRPPSGRWLVLSSIVAWMAVAVFWIANEVASEIVGTSIDTGLGQLVVIVAVFYGLSLPVSALLVALVMRFVPDGRQPKGRARRSR